MGGYSLSMECVHQGNYCIDVVGISDIPFGLYVVEHGICGGIRSSTVGYGIGSYKYGLSGPHQLKY